MKEGVKPEVGRAPASFGREETPEREEPERFEDLIHGLMNLEKGSDELDTYLENNLSTDEVKFLRDIADAISNHVLESNETAKTNDPTAGEGVEEMAFVAQLRLTPAQLEQKYGDLLANHPELNRFGFPRRFDYFVGSVKSIYVPDNNERKGRLTDDSLSEAVGAMDVSPKTKKVVHQAAADIYPDYFDPTIGLEEDDPKTKYPEGDNLAEAKAREREMTKLMSEWAAGRGVALEDIKKGKANVNYVLADLINNKEDSILIKHLKNSKSDMGQRIYLALLEVALDDEKNDARYFLGNATKNLFPDEEKHLKKNKTKVQNAYTGSLRRNRWALDKIGLASSPMKLVQQIRKVKEALDQEKEK